MHKHLLNSSYDLHIHAAPSPFYRLMDEFQLLRSASAAGMAGILIKSHYEPTAARAELANQYAGATAKAYGALVLNQPVGGLNPYAVQNALHRGAKMIFMPTRDAANSLVSGDMPGDFFHRPGITILTKEGKLKPEIHEIIDIVKQYDAVIATGHLSPDESVALCQAGLSAGVQMVLTHPEYSRTRIPGQLQRELAGQGVLIEKCWYNIAGHECSAEQMAATIHSVGAEHCFMTTDRGQGDREAPVEGMENFISAMLAQGLSDQELKTMLQQVPKRILRLD